MKNEQRTASPPSDTLAEAGRHYAAGVKLLKERKLDAALRELGRAVALRPLFPEALRAASLAFKAKGDKPRANKYMNAAMVACLKQGRLDVAVTIHRTARASGMEVGNPYFIMASSLHKKGRTTTACQWYEKALGLTPDACAVAMGLARALLAADRQEQARRFFASYLARHPHCGELCREHADLASLLADAQEPRNATPPPQAPQAEVLGEVLDGADQGGFEFDVDGVVTSDGHVPETTLQKLVEQPKIDWREKRRSPRLPMAEYFLRFPKRKEHQQVVDICREGVGFKLGDMALRRGQKLKFDLMAFEKVKIKKLHVVVRHITHGLVGCEFLGLNSRQLKSLDAILFSEEPACDEEKQGAEGSNVCFDLEMW